MNIIEANNKRGYIYCETLEERNRIAKLLHDSRITHITMGSKNYADYLSRTRKKVYSTDEIEFKFISLYGSDFFGILEKASTNYSTINSTQIN